MKFTLALAAALVATVAFAPPKAFAKDVIEFPTEELASESVVPVFDHPESVKARNVSTAKRVELGLFGGYAMTEALFNPLSFGAMASYHINETHGINLMGSANMQGISGNAANLNPVPPTTVNLNMQYAPAPKYLLLGNYQFTAFYGKLSFTKDYVMNLGLYGLAGLGVIGIGDSTNPAASIGLGQKFYFSKNFGLRFDLRFLFYQGPDVLSRSLSNDTTVRSAADFQKSFQTSSLLSMAAIYLLPSF